MDTGACSERSEVRETNAPSADIPEESGSSSLSGLLDIVVVVIQGIAISDCSGDWNKNGDEQHNAYLPRLSKHG